VLDHLRYFLGVYCAILAPVGVVFWFVIHPWARWWRRLGPTRTYLIVIPPLVVCGVLLFRVRVWLLGANLGTNWILIGIAIVLTGVTLWLEPQYWKHLNIATLVGVPELAPTAQRTGKLLQEGVYGVVRHPRYVIAGIGMLASVLFVNYLGLYLLMLIVVPAGLVMVAFEERELVGRFGEDYRRYQREVPRFIPRWRKTIALVVTSGLLLPFTARADEMRGRLEMPTACAATHLEDPVPAVSGRVAGTRPVWLADGSDFGHFAGAMRPVKSLWILSREVTGSFRVEGRRLDGPGTTRFQVGGMDTPITDTLVIENPAAQSVTPGGASAEVMRSYVFIPSYVFYPSPGCWQISARLGDRDVEIVLEVK
jgi:protein-S-isoprenylcysteine O-methyltransferase Ste14